MPRNVFEEEENVPINETDGSEVKLSSSAEIREKQLSIFSTRAHLGTGTGHFHGGSAAGKGFTSATGATSVPSQRGFGVSFVMVTPVPGVGWRPPNTFTLIPTHW